MKLLVIMCFITAVATAPSPRSNNSNTKIEKFNNEHFGTGSYKYQFELSDGTAQEQEGVVTNEGKEDESIAVRGSYTWIAPGGEVYIVNYIADENGFRPEISEGQADSVPQAIVDVLLG